MKRRLLCLLIILFLPFSCAFAKYNNDRITIVQDLPDPMNNVVDSQAFKPEELSEASKAIIDADNRTIQNPTEYPFTAIAYLDISYDCSHEGAYGTGFLIGKDWLITAGHCFYCPICRKPADKFTLYFGYLKERNYLVRYEDSNWNAWIISDAVRQGTNYYEYDYGVIHLSEPIGLKTGWFKLRYNVPDSELEHGIFHVTGYRNGILKHDADRVQPVDELYLRHFADTEMQNSGCPVYDDSYGVVAINSAEKRDGSENYAVRITAEIYALLLENGYSPNPETD